jgi:hypothetical protein
MNLYNKTTSEHMNKGSDQKTDFFTLTLNILSTHLMNDQTNIYRGARRIICII